MTKRFLSCAAAVLLVAACTPKSFVSIDGTTLVGTDGKPFLIKGTNLGNWLNPEGYMFGFGRTNSPRMIDDLLCEMVGPDEAAAFWKQFKDNYITEEDIAFIASTGANTVRLPFHYKLFTDEDYMGLSAGQDGFDRIDACVQWCRKYGLYLILDMHDAPGGQTGDNIDDSYGYPWLFESEPSRRLFCDIWQRIARHYRDEPVILGYELINEPIAPYFGERTEQLNTMLEGLHKEAVAAIREVDRNHIILLGGAQWNGNFKPFTDWTYDDKIMYTCHRYGGEPTKEAIQAIIDFRDKTGLPMYMGEIGHNTDAWQSDFCRTMEENNIGWTFWPYKKMDGSCMVSFHAPKGWQEVRRFSEAARGTYGEIREAGLDRAVAREALAGLLEAVKFRNCRPQGSYIRSIRLDYEDPAIRVLVLREMGGHHLPFTEAAMPWLRGLEGMEITEIHDTEPITKEYLSGFDVFLQLDYPPYAWTEAAVEAFEDYIDNGRGGWIGLHHASLLGEFDGYPMWPWFSDFLGGIRFGNYIAELSDGTVRKEGRHPVLKGLPDTFRIEADEWYTYDRDPRDHPDIQVLATVDEASYSARTAVKMGDHPVIWTNRSKPARNLYVQFGHSPSLVENPDFRTLMTDALRWAAGR